MINGMNIRNEIANMKEMREKAFNEGNPDWLYWDGVVKALEWVVKSNKYKTIGEFITAQDNKE